MTTLTLVSSYPSNAPELQPIRDWAESIADTSGGAHEIRIYGAGEVVGGFEALDAVESGVADLAFVSSSAAAGLAAQAETVGAGFDVSDTSYSARAFLRGIAGRLGNAAPDDVHLLGGSFGEPFVLFLREAASAGPFGLEGLKVVHPGGAYLTAALEALGAVPVRVAYSEVHVAMQTGVVDAALFPASRGAIDLDLSDVSEMQIVFPGMQSLFTGTNTLFISQDVLDGLPADLRQLLNGSALALSGALSQNAVGLYDDAIAQLEAQGGLVTATGADLAQWQRVFDQFNALYLAGLPGDGGGDGEGPGDDGLPLDEDAYFDQAGPFSLIVPSNLGVSSAGELDGATVILATGTAMEIAVSDYFRANSMIYEPVPVETAEEAVLQFLAGAGDVLVVPDAALAGITIPAGYMVLPETIAGEGDAATPAADLLEGGSGADSIDGLGGDDTITGGQGDDTLSGGPGDDEIYGNQHNDMLRGFGGADRLDGGVGNDVVLGHAGADTLFGGAGYDTLRGGSGDDTVVGGDGRDLVFLGGGDDLFADNTQGGVNGRDTVYGNAGDDTIGGGAGNDVFHGGDGADLVLGRLGDDHLFGNNQNDTLNGAAGNDIIAGGNGRDRAIMGAGNDTWIDNGQSAFGDDFVNGGAGADRIGMGGGNDTAIGGAGADTFVFSARIDHDTIGDYTPGVDSLHISGALWSGPLTEARLDALSSIENGELVLRFGDGNSITFEGLASNDGLLADIVLI